MSGFFFFSKIKQNRLALPLMLAGMVVLTGSVGFHLIEGWPLLDSAYVATQTVTTVGYGDITPATRLGRLFAILLMLLGIGSVLYGLTLLAQSVLQAEMLDILGYRRKLKKMDKLTDHYIVCGAGRVGRRIIRNLQRQQLPFVIIETDERRVSEFSNDKVHIIIGDATSEANLLTAGVTRARGLASCLPDDALNVYVVLTARGINPELHIVARAVEEQAEPKLIQAGASRVVAPTIIGSQSMARALLKPAIADFMDSIVAETLDLVFEEVAIDGRSQYAGKALRDTNIMSELNLIVVAIRRRSGELEFQPNGDTIVNDGDLLIVIGNATSVKQLVDANG